MTRSAPSVEKEAAFMHGFSYEDSNKPLTGSDVLQAASEEIRFVASPLQMLSVVWKMECSRVVDR